MNDLYTSEIGIAAELDYRRRQSAALRRSSPVLPTRKPLRVTIAEALAHLALHLDSRSIGAVSAQHSPASGHGHGRAA
jgi:hypothetical protein